MSDNKEKDSPKARPGSGVKLTPPPKAEVPVALGSGRATMKDAKPSGLAEAENDAEVGTEAEAEAETKADAESTDEPSSTAESTPQSTSSPELQSLLGSVLQTTPVPGRPKSGKLPAAPTPVPGRPKSGKLPAAPTPVPGRPKSGKLPAAPTPPPTPASASSTAGMRIGDYTIDEEIGAGGMSVVYRSHQASLGRSVAVKILRAEIAAQPHLVERFEREAQSLAALQHENILHIYEYRVDGEVPFMVTEFVEGVDLYDVLDRHQQLPVDVAAVVTSQVARALDYAHSRGVIHRDVKPANIMFTAQGGIKLMDFGIARQADSPDLTAAGAGVGTPAYMSPEQILCEKLDGRTDLWSLGVALYQMVTGQKPFLQDDNRSVLHKIRSDKPTPPRQLNSAVPRPLERIILRCLEKRPADRYPVAQQLALALERFVAARVAMGHQAQLLYYLQGAGEFSEEQVQAALPDLADGGVRANFPRPPRRHSERPPLGVPWAVWVGGVSGLLLLTLLIVVLAAWPNRDTAGKCEPCESKVGASVPPGPTILPGAVVGKQARASGRGGLRVVVHPWAEVLIGGKVVETTPFDHPLYLSAGVHRVVLRHPKLGRVIRTVKIQVGEVQTLRVDLSKGGVKP